MPDDPSKDSPRAMKANYRSNKKRDEMDHSAYEGNDGIDWSFWLMKVLRVLALIVCLAGLSLVFDFFNFGRDVTSSADSGGDFRGPFGILISIIAAPFIFLFAGPIAGLLQKLGIGTDSYALKATRGCGLVVLLALFALTLVIGVFVLIG